MHLKVMQSTDLALVKKIRVAVLFTSQAKVSYFDDVVIRQKDVAGCQVAMDDLKASISLNGTRKKRKVRVPSGWPDVSFRAQFGKTST